MNLSRQRDFYVYCLVILFVLHELMFRTKFLREKNKNINLSNVLSRCSPSYCLSFYMPAKFNLIWINDNRVLLP